MGSYSAQTYKMCRSTVIREGDTKSRCNPVTVDMLWLRCQFKYLYPLRGAVGYVIPPALTGKMHYEYAVHDPVQQK
jgi:hypothetical protein